MKILFFLYDYFISFSAKNKQNSFFSDKPDNASKTTVIIYAILLKRVIIKNSEKIV